MKKLAVFIFFTFFSVNLFSQVKIIDSLRNALSKSQGTDLAKLEILINLSYYYVDSRPDSAIIFGQLGLEIALKYNAKKEQNTLFSRIASSYSDLGDYGKSLSIYFKLKDNYLENNDLINVAAMDNNIGYTFDTKEEYQKALSYSKSGLKVLNDYENSVSTKSVEEQRIKTRIKTLLYLNFGSQFLHLNKLDSALKYLKLSYFYLTKHHVKVGVFGTLFSNFGQIEKRKGNKNLALLYYRKAIPFSIKEQDIDNLCVTYLGIADLYHQYRQQDSAKYYAKKALEIAEQRKFLPDQYKAAQALFRYFEEEKNISQAYKYLKLTTSISASLFSQNKIKQLLALDFEERQREREIEIAKEAERSKVKFYFLLLGTVILVLVALLFWRESRQRAKANRELQKKQAELDLINQNLESMIQERTRDLVDKNKKLFDYTYYLSHQIRGPVSTIRGLVNIEKEGLIDPQDFVKMVGTCVAEIDNKITAINNILHEPTEPSN